MVDPQRLKLRIPALRLASVIQSDDVARFREAGMEDVITKPLSSDRLKAVLTEYSAPGFRGLSGQSDSPMADMIEVFGAEKTEIIRQRVVNEVETGIADLAAMVGDETRRREIAKLAHKLAGSVAMFGMQSVWEHLKVLEDQSTGMSSDEIHFRLSEVKRLMQN